MGPVHRTVANELVQEGQLYSGGYAREGQMSGRQMAGEQLSIQGDLRLVQLSGRYKCLTGQISG